MNLLVGRIRIVSPYKFQVRLNYLYSKQLDKEKILKIVRKNRFVSLPHFSTNDNVVQKYCMVSDFSHPRYAFFPVLDRHYIVIS